MGVIHFLFLRSGQIIMIYIHITISFYVLAAIGYIDNCSILFFISRLDVVFFKSLTIYVYFMYLLVLLLVVIYYGV